MKEQKLAELTEEMKGCKACDLHKNRVNVVPGIYGPKNGLCIIGEAPGFNEDQKGLPFIGRSGKLLDKMFANVGLERQKDFSILNVVKCRPTTPEGGNRTPKTSELKFCGKRWLYKQLDLLQPKLLVSVGSISLKFFRPKEKITKVVGQLLETPLGYPLFVTFHPAYILRNYRAEMIEKYENHFQTLSELVKDDSKLNAFKNEVDGKTEQKSLTDYLK